MTRRRGLGFILTAGLVLLDICWGLDSLVSAPVEAFTCKNIALGLQADAPAIHSRRRLSAANRGNSISPLWLAQRLRPFRVKPKQLWVGDRKERGYFLGDFKDAFLRYAPLTSGRPGRTEAGRGFPPNSQVVGTPHPIARENARKPNSGAGPTGSTTCEGGGRRE